MSLKDIKIGFKYRSDKGNIVDDFYIPCLKESNEYWRAVGYFTSNSLATAAKGIVEFTKKRGKMKLIASPYLEKEDIEAIESGYDARENIINKCLLRQITNIEDVIIKERLNYLAWMVAEELLEIKIAVLKNISELGIYHEKLGIFFDPEGNVVSFSGSANETTGGIYSNFESIKVHCLWKQGQEDIVNSDVEDFENLWNNCTEKLDVIDFPQAVKSELIKYRYYDENSYFNDGCCGYSPKTTKINSNPSIPNFIELRDYQKNAIISWFSNNGRGILEMATGTGKTITALSAACKLYEKLKKLAVIIVVPYTHLVVQWADEAKMFNFSPILGFESKELWEEELNSKVISYNMDTINNFCLITTNDTFLTESMQNIISKLKGKAILIADEAHHLGAQKISRKLPLSIPYRLGLSATPERWYDAYGTNKLNEYFTGGVIFRFTLKDAIGKYLTDYYYYPHLVTLTDEESDEYCKISRQIIKLLPKDGDFEMNSSEKLKYLLIKRSRIINSAENKLRKLKELLSDKSQSKYNIFYCGDGEVAEQRQIDEVLRILGRELRMRVHTFTSRETKEKRHELLQQFENGELQGLVAIRCLDEGVDVPATQNAYILASSTNPREFIQRRGRILRKHPNKMFAYIHDFIVIPTEPENIKYLDTGVFNIERKLVEKELRRFSEFAETAINGPQASLSILEVKKLYNLLDM